MVDLLPCLQEQFPQALGILRIRFRFRRRLPKSSAPRDLVPARLTLAFRARFGRGLFLDRAALEDGLRFFI